MGGRETPGARIAVAACRRHDGVALVWLASAALVAVFLILVLAPGSARAAEGDPICVDCHNYVSLEVVDTWRSQNHGSNGVTCDVCHNTHDSDFRPFPTVEVCMGCHEVESIHQGFLPDTPAAACMDCHTSNVHLYPGQASWFYSGLTEEKLAGEDTDPTGEIAPSTGRRAAVVGAVIAVVLGLALGFLMDRFVRNL